MAPETHGEVRLVRAGWLGLELGTEGGCWGIPYAGHKWVQRGKRSSCTQAEPISGVYLENILKEEHKMPGNLVGSEDFSPPGLQLQMQGQRCNSYGHASETASRKFLSQCKQGSPLFIVQI